MGNLPDDAEKAAVQARLARVVEIAADAVVMTDEAHNLVYFNRAAEQMFGYAAAEVLGRPVHLLVPPERAEIHAEHMRRFAAAAEQSRPETRSDKLRGRRKDGSEFPLDGTVARLSEGGTVVLVAILRDSTARRRAEEELRESERRFRLLAENAMDVVYRYRVAAPAGLEYVSPSVAAVTGYAPEELRAEPGLGFLTLHPDDVEPVRAALAEPEGLRQPRALRLRRKDGAWIWLEQRGTPIYDGTGTCVAVEGIARDITARMHAEEESRLLESAIVAAAHAVDLPGALDVVLRKICATIGWPFGEVWIPSADGSRLECCPVWHGPDAAVAGFRAAKERLTFPPGLGLPGRAWSAKAPVWIPDVQSEVRFLRPDLARMAGLRAALAVPVFCGDEVVAVLDFFAAEPRAEDPHLVELVSAVAEQLGALVRRKRAEDALRASHAQLERALVELQRTQLQVVQQERLRAIGQLARGMGHDFNNALMPILGFGELLLSSPQQLDDREKVLSYLKMMLAGARDAAAVVERLREFYRERREDEVFAPADVNQVVEQAVARARAEWRETGRQGGRLIRVETDLHPLPVVSASAAGLGEVVGNLLANAFDAMPDGGTLHVRTRREGDHLEVEVCDTGTGMPEEVRARCLEPFFTTKGPQGSGLGLAVAHGIVRRHGGAIEVHSEVGHGTRVLVRLPGPAPVPAPPEVEPAPAAPAGPQRLLVVDDDPLVRRVLQECLQADGHQVQTAVDGDEGLAKFRDGVFDLVLTDKAMPGMNGEELARAIKEIDPAMPVMLVTGFGDLMNAAGERPAGVDLVVGKPVTLAELRAAMAKVLARRTEGAQA